MTPSAFTESLAWTLRLTGHPIDRGELEAFVAACWPWIEEDPDVTRWAGEYLEQRIGFGRTVA